MAILRRPRLLRCFYCNQRTSIQYDGHIRQFQCRGCDATNYLDQNGDITDPPASKTTAAETASTFYASPPDPFNDGFGSPDSAGSNGFGSQSGGVFCNTCLKNQHLFVSSLAQYFPSDPNDPETPELERRYFTFRKGLEQRYPQICADCEPRVIERIRDADYTAKTDHLRRMVQYSRDVRLTQTTPLDLANRIGRWLWWSGLVLQILWQAGVLGSFLSAASASSAAGELDAAGFEDDVIVDESYASTGHDAAPSQSSTLVAMAIPLLLQPVLRMLAANAGRLQSLCIGATVAGCWWNPYLVETVRGFTKPLNGIPTWYAYQAALFAVRFLLSKVAFHSGSAAHSVPVSALPPTIAGAHAVAALFTFYLYSVAPRAITKDMRPLFGKLPEIPVTPQKSSRPTERQSESRRRGLETLSDVLDEISVSPQHASTSRHSRRDSDTEGWDGWQPSKSSPRSQQITRSWQATGGLGAQYGSQYESTTPASQSAAYYGDEMDWTPTQTPSRPVASQFTTPSPHRAFNTYSAGRSPPSQRPPSSVGTFNQTPVEANKGPFWYKVPPAPTSIAQRIFNRPNAPRIIDQSGFETDVKNESTSPFFSRNEGQALGFDTPPQAGASSAVEFAQPSFFAEDLKRKANGGRGVSDDDPGSFLSDLFSQTFSLGQQNGNEADDDTEEDEGLMPDASQGAAAMAYQGASAGTSTARSRRRSSVHHRQRASISRGQLIVRRLPLLLITVASFACMSLLREGLQSYGSAGADVSATAAGEPVGSIDLLLFEYVRPYARLIESAAVGLCMVLAISLTRESMRRWTRSTHAAVSSAVGLVLGLASIVLAGWMATQMWTLVQQPAPPPSEIYLAFDDYGDGWHDDESQLAQQQKQEVGSAVLPWPWWQLASLHSSVILHQVWLMLV
ncbi:integral inner nuclear membrane protein ima1 [Ophiostoma piceae UAMH 11346]|uniref:Integral inner nuclear membrane protein ima1 n=1 Tax=Ophiostoma piceae (strain UAMH 11346) TaxID=1262450 RepID=S3C6W5_OPHP1|nr:integral inner nuclear membrane protein ima1 [Ophiostoma piceae UAMH 11346]